MSPTGIGVLVIEALDDDFMTSMQWLPALWMNAALQRDCHKTVDGRG